MFAPLRDEGVDDLAVLVNSSIGILPFAGAFHIGFINEPAATNRMSTPLGTAGVSRVK